jgi:hypothetical protein
MPLVRALAATDFHREGADRSNPALRTAMFEGQVYDVPEDEATRLRDAGLVEDVAIPTAASVEEESPPPLRRARRAKESS